MKKSEVKVTVTPRDLLDKGVWIEYCNKYDTNEWAISEGLMSSHDEVDITLEDAEAWGLFDGDEKVMMDALLDNFDADPKNLEELKKLITDEIEWKYQDRFNREARYMGNGIYSISGLYSTDTRELYLMFIGQQEFNMTFE